MSPFFRETMIQGLAPRLEANRAKALWDRWDKWWMRTSGGLCQGCVVRRESGDWPRRTDGQKVGEGMRKGGGGGRKWKYNGENQKGNEDQQEIHQEEKCARFRFSGFGLVVLKKWANVAIFYIYFSSNWASSYSGYRGFIKIVFDCKTGAITVDF